MTQERTSAVTAVRGGGAAATPRDRLAIIVTCHNRRDVSVRTITEVLRQGSEFFDLRVFALDDGSSDGTALRLAELGDQVEVIAGTGDLFWAGGMRVASRAAEGWGADFYCWLNDDVRLSPGLFAAIRGRLNQLSSADATDCVLIGEIADESGEVHYGCRTQSTRNRLSFLLTRSSETVDTFNGNLVLFGAGAYSTVGGVPAGYRHGYADYVVGLRASRAGLRIERMPIVAGVDTGGLKKLVMFDPGTALCKRVAAARHFTGLPPRDQWRFCVEVVGIKRAPFYFIRSYIRVLAPKNSG